MDDDRTAEPDALSGLGAWVLAAAFAAVMFRWLGALSMVESVFLATVLVLLPRLAGAQVALDDPVLNLDKRAIYLQSGLMLAVLGGMGLWLGVSRGGFAYVGLRALEPGRDAAWALVLTGIALALMIVFYAAHKMGSSGESALVRHLIPRTGSEKVAFAGLSVMAGVGEEIAFRGFALVTLIEITGLPLISAVVTSVSFGWVHAYQGTLGMTRAGLLGLLFCAPMLFLGTLWPAIVAHTLVDWISGLVLGDRLLGREPETVSNAQ